MNYKKYNGGSLRYLDVENQQLPPELRLSSQKLNPYDMAKIELDIEENDIINFLKIHFDRSMFQNYKKLGLFVVAQDVNPTNVDKDDAFNINGKDIYRAIIFYLTKLIPNKDILTKYNINFSKNLILYCDRNYDLNNDISATLYAKYNYNVIQIYHDDYLHISYLNQEIPISGIINNINWIPYQNVYTTAITTKYSVRYNKIIEEIMKLYFGLLDKYLININTADVERLNSEIVYENIKKDVEIEQYEIPSGYYKMFLKNKITTKTYENLISEQYLYQLWLFYNHKIRFNNRLTSEYLTKDSENQNEISNKIDNIDLANYKQYHKKIIDIVNRKLTIYQTKILQSFYNYEALGLIRCLDVTDTIKFIKTIKKRQIYEYSLENNLFKKKDTDETFIRVIIVVIISIFILSIFFYIIRFFKPENDMDD
tara:strand:+ start:7629 stop:8906 length:1278 start_codon:yes stop_codon:yes gene_type:complete